MLLVSKKHLLLLAMLVALAYSSIQAEYMQNGKRKTKIFKSVKEYNQFKKNLDAKPSGKNKKKNSKNKPAKKKGKSSPNMGGK